MNLGYLNCCHPPNVPFQNKRFTCSQTIRVCPSYGLSELVVIIHLVTDEKRDTCSFTGLYNLYVNETKKLYDHY